MIRPTNTNCATVNVENKTLAQEVKEAFPDEHFVIRMSGNGLIFDFDNPIDQATLNNVVAGWIPA